MESNWQPIETAPKDGKILAYDPDFGLQVMVFSDGFWWDTIDSILKTIPTHWMPLPEPPVQN
jgi:hypothetical protein